MFKDYTVEIKSVLSGTITPVRVAQVAPVRVAQVAPVWVAQHQSVRVAHFAPVWVAQVGTVYPNWRTIISTDLKLNFNDTVEIYQIRWSIEVFFKESKQMLGLGKSQSNDFDAQIADTTICMVQYIFLALRNRIDKYESLGKLFENTKADVIELRLQERLIALLIAILEVIVTLFEQLDEQDVIKKIINDEQAFEKIRLLINPHQNKLKSVA